MVWPWKRLYMARQHPAVRWPLLCLISYLVILLLVSLLENSLVYPRWAIPAANWQPIRLDFEDVYFQAEDGPTLHGWYFPHPEPRAHILYCHGNGTNVGHLGPEMHAISRELGVSMFVFDYRGYGKSEGRPYEAGLYRDARAAQAWLAQRENLRPDQIVLMGRSLGAAVAVDAAVTQGARGLILERTFASMPEVAATIYWWLPVRWLMRNRFDSHTKIQAYQGPLLQSHGTADTIIPFAHGKKLFEACPSPNKRFLVLDGVEHNDLDPPEYQRALDEFLDELPALDGP